MNIGIDLGTTNSAVAYIDPREAEGATQISNCCSTMCGILGFTSRNPELARKMCAALSHRGPDQHGIYDDDHVTLGHRRLSILDLSENGRQPMSTSDATSRTGIGLNRIRSTTVKTASVTPMPSASVSTAPAVNQGARMSDRIA